MVRRYYRRRNIANRDKYSVENTCITPPPKEDWTVVQASEGISISSQFAIAILPPTGIQGMRKVKHFTLTFSDENSDETLYYALVYVPEGYDPNHLQTAAEGSAISLYEPNQYVISAGVLDFSGGPLRIRSPLSRNLNSGDSIYLIMATQNRPEGRIRVNVQYAITLQ